MSGTELSPREYALTRVADSARAQEAAMRTLRTDVAEAHAAGVAIADLARAARVTRQTIYRWLEAPPTGSVPVKETLTDALTLVATLVSPYIGSQVNDRVRNGETDVMIRGLDLGMKALPPDVLPRLTDGERQLLATARTVASQAQQAHRAHGKWPEAVRIGEPE